MTIPGCISSIVRMNPRTASRSPKENAAPIPCVNPIFANTEVRDALAVIEREWAELSAR